jgi:hypothetical protein
MAKTCSKLKRNRVWKSNKDQSNKWVKMCVVSYQCLTGTCCYSSVFVYEKKQLSIVLAKIGDNFLTVIWVHCWEHFTHWCVKKNVFNQEMAGGTIAKNINIYKLGNTGSNYF